jgi:DNA-binding SARP family transcriptional activator
VAVAAADRASDEGVWSQAVNLLDPALAAWRGPALADVAGAFAEPMRARLEERRLRAVELGAAAAIELGRHEEEIDRLRAVLRADPGRERAAGLLMVALSRAERRAEALAVVQQVKFHLREEHGLDAGPLLLDLEVRILRGDPAILTAPAQPPRAPDGGRKVPTRTSRPAASPGSPGAGRT